MISESGPPDGGEKGRLALTAEQEAALKSLAAGEGEPLVLAKILRPVANFLETYPSDDTEYARTVRGLVQLSSSDAFAMAESGRVSVDQAAFLGHCARNVFAYHHPPQVSENFQLRAMTRLADGEAISAVDKVANDTLNEQQKERHRIFDRDSTRRRQQRC